jgi:hypothetical protein
VDCTGEVGGESSTAAAREERTVGVFFIQLCLIQSLVLHLWLFLRNHDPWRRRGTCIDEWSQRADAKAPEVYS